MLVNKVLLPENKSSYVIPKCVINAPYVGIEQEDSIITNSYKALSERINILQLRIAGN